MTRVYPLLTHKGVFYNTAPHETVELVLGELYQRQALRAAVPIEMMSWLKDPFATFVQAETPTDSAKMVLRKIRFGSKL